MLLKGREVLVVNKDPIFRHITNHAARGRSPIAKEMW